MLNVTIVKILVIMLPNVERLAIIELSALQPCCWLVKTMKEAKIINGT